MISQWLDNKTSSTSANLQSSIEKNDFIVGLHIGKRLASLLRPLSTALQAQEANLLQSLKLIKGVKNELENERSG